MGLSTVSAYNEPMNQTKHTDIKPSELLSLVNSCANKITRGNKGLSEKELNTLCNEDSYFRKNLLLEIRDVMIASQTLYEKLNDRKTL